MWGPGPWIAPMWSFWWIFTVVGLLICFLLVVVVMRGSRFMCIGPHRNDSDEMDRLQHEVEEPRNKMNNQQAAQ